MTVTISLPAQTEALLLARATASGKDVPTLILEAVEEKFAAANAASMAGQKPAGDLDQILDEFFEANPGEIPVLPSDFSRADIYADHD
jgi:hypothetical protein